MLKTTKSSKKLTLRAFKAENNEVVRSGADKTDKTVVDLSKFKNKKSRKLMYMPNIGATREPNFLIPNTKEVLTIYG